MKGKKILYISSEVIPYMPQTEIATMTYSLPKLVNENGGQTRIFIPKYGIINERRHQLHEVIRLSGICLLYTSPSPRDGLLSRMPSSAWKK